MRLSLRARYMLYISVFTLLCMMANFAVDLLHDVVAGASAETESIGGEASEFVFILSINILLLPIVLALGWCVVRRLVAPLNQVSETARHIIDGDLNSRVPLPPGDDELTRLVEMLNLAFDRYDGVLAQMRDFNANAAHQLRTPLAAVRAAGEVCLSKDRHPEEYRETMRSVLERVEQLSRMVEQMLALAELESDDIRNHFQPIEISRVIQDAVFPYKLLAKEKGVALTAATNDSALVNGDELLVDQMIGNLVDNAIRFAPSGGFVDVNAKAADENTVVINVVDNGSGIPKVQRESIFKRFNLGSSPNGSQSGLGLAIVREIVRLHRGEIKASEREGGGTAMVIRLPRVRRTSPATRGSPS